MKILNKSFIIIDENLTSLAILEKFCHRANSKEKVKSKIEFDYVIKSRSHLIFSWNI